ncbi:MAG: 1-acyl-sn-glycerol-3-phosphate acyltransferase [Holophagaceae bacterium]|nr:1-acyl-sn-glycerol-3-phosphate acyltransferase [Holophagaceae bacterium]
MRTAQSLPASSWAYTDSPLGSEILRAAWHPLTLWAWMSTLASTAYILPQLGQADDPACVLSRWSRNLLRSLHIEMEFVAPIPEGAQIWVANHLSWVDPLILMAQRPMGTLAKAEVAAYPLLGRHACRAGLRFVDRENPTHRATALLELIRHWRTGAPFLLFPEGTTTTGGKLAPFYEGGLRAAFRLGLSVLPLHLESPDAHYAWTGEDSLPPHIHTLCRARRTRVRIRPGPVMAPHGDEGLWLRNLRNHLEPHSN